MILWPTGSMASSLLSTALISRSANLPAGYVSSMWGYAQGPTQQPVIDSEHCQSAAKSKECAS